jgi:chloramphenicol-sensitive protein RarD
MGKQTEQNIGIWYAIIAYASWGVLPLYWKLLEAVPAGEILAHRIFWSFIFVVFILLFTKRWKQFKAVLSNRSKLAALTLCSILVTSNWFIYIWAVNNGHVLESSLGYYINPLLSIVLGMVILKERLNFWQYASVLLAALGVILIAVRFGKFPWISLSLALTFALYGLAKKLAKVDSIIGLALETAIVTPLAFLYLTFKQVHGTHAFGTSLSVTLLLAGAGIVTAMPLLWFAQAANRVSLATIGFTQYLSPTIMLFLSFFVFHEPFTTPELISFSFIWCALIIYTFSNSSFLKRVKPASLKRKNISA